MPEIAKGLEGVVAAESRICKIDGQNGKLYYLGYSIEDLVKSCSFEEVTFLLLNGQLPNRAQLDEFSKSMRSQRSLPDPVVRMIREFPDRSHPMEMLQAAVLYLAGYRAEGNEAADPNDCRKAVHLIAQLPTVIAVWQRAREGKKPIEPRSDLSHGANFLYMLSGDEPGEVIGRVMDGCLVLHAEHSFNASTFTGRVVASTLSTCYSSISAAIGALYGSLHGGANERVMEMADKIVEPEKAAEWVNRALDKKEKIMGMGHRVYRAKDPRAIIIEEYLEELTETTGDAGYFKLLKEVERTFRERMEEKGKPIYPNVDFFSGAVYRMLGIPTILFTPVFAMSRISGWLSHIIEQLEDNRIYRPTAHYVGEIGKKIVPLEQR